MPTDHFSLARDEHRRLFDRRRGGVRIMPGGDGVASTVSAHIRQPHGLVDRGGRLLVKEDPGPA